MSFTIGSLFDGSGGFPLAAFMCGGVPVWASEIEPYPIAVTKSRFPYVKHLGDVSKIKGNEIDPVDVVSFGSPCQDLSVAGLRKGLKHEDNGDDETTRSGLFMEAVRIIKEMREATDGRYPTFAIWENVPGAFNSNKGEDFRIVLEELVKIVEPSTFMPAVPKNGWSYADCYVGDGWSLAYRVFDAQYWGVPQRRRRIYLVVDFGGERALEILFKRESLRGYFEEGRTPWEGFTSDAERSAVSDDSERNSIVIFDARGNGEGDISPTITGDHNNRITDYTSVVVEPTYIIDGDKLGKAERAGGSGLGVRESDKMYTLTAKDVHSVAYNPIVLDRAFYNQGQNALYDPQYYDDGSVPPIVAKGPSAVAYGINGDIAGTLDASYYKGCGMRQGVEREVVAVPEEHRYIVRRITPTECARLQGFLDEWGHPDKKDDFTEDEYRFWLNVRKTHDEINGRKPKDYAKKQILAWYNKLHTDSAEYKMWGNGIALPNALYVMQGIADAFN